jgi:AbiV family abortive infection protein
MVNKTQFQLTKEQTEKAIKMCLENAESYLNDTDMYISNKKINHLAIPIVFAIEEIGKAKIIYDKLEKDNSKISLSREDGIYDHKIKTEKAISLIELDVGEKMLNGLIFGDDMLDYLLDPLTISVNIRKENELKNTVKKGHGIRLASSYVDFDPITNEPKIDKSSGDLTELIKNLFEIIHSYPSSFNTN